MPAIITPPELETRRTTGPGEGDHGAGRKPPIDKRTGGGGSGDGDDDLRAEPVGKRGPRERLATARIGLAFGLMAVVIVFVGLIAAFLVTKSSYHFDAYGRFINEWLPTALPSILWLTTAVLLVSSITAEFARRSMFQEHDVMDEWFGMGKPTSRRAALWLSLTLILGMIFLVGQWVAWLQLRGQHVFFASNSSGHFFYLITAAHALHLFVGLSAIIAALAALRSSRQFATRQIFVDTTVWYWHAMGLLWLGLFVLLEYCQ